MWQQIWSWGVVGTIALFILGGGVTFMTTSLPWIADAFYVAGAALFLIKFLTWEEAKKQEPDIRRRTSAYAIVGTLLAIAFAVGGNHYLNRSRITPSPFPQPAAKTQQESPTQTLQRPSETQKTPSLPRKTKPLPTRVTSANTSTEKTITLHDLFKTDFPHVMKMLHKVGYTSKEGKQSTFEYQIYMDYESKSKFMGIYIPISEPFSDSNKITYNICALVSYDFKNFINTGDKGVQIAFKNYGEQQTGNKDLTFSGRIFVYHEDNLSVEQIAELRKLYRENNLDVQFRGVDYLMFQNLSKRASQQSPPPTKRDPRSRLPLQE